MKKRYQSRIELLQGTLDLLILQSLIWGPQHGYAISRGIRSQSGDVLQVDTGSLYPALHRLEKQKWIASDWKLSENNQRAKYYRLTASRPKTTRLRKIPLGSNLRGGRRRSRSVETENRVMNLKFWRKRDRHSDLDEEIRCHLQLAADERIERGEAPAQAASNSRREFGNVALIQEITRDNWGWASLERVMQDIRFGARVLAKSPGFAAVAILTLALGIGANTALFSIVNGVLLNPLPYPEPDRLVTLHESKPNFASGSISFPNFLDWQRENHSFSEMAIARPSGFTLTGQGESEQINAEFISADFFTVLGVKPVFGRMFLPGEDRVGAPPIVLISEGFWKRKFASSPDVLGKSVALNGKDYTIVGVVPENFNLSLLNFSATELYAPIGQWDNPFLTSRFAGLGFHGIGRLKPGVTLEQARADMAAVTQGLAENYPDANKGVGATIIPLAPTNGRQHPTDSAGALRRGGLRAADRVRECCQSADRTLHRPRAGIRHSHRAGRRARAIASPVRY